MSEADLYERVAKAEAEIRWIKDKLAERLGIHQGEARRTALSDDAYPSTDETDEIPPRIEYHATLGKPFIPRSGE